MIPLALYIHFPWCVKKCPYCDFNSHTLKEDLPEKDYIKALLKNLDNSMEYTQGRTLSSIFMGGGTPSLFSPKSFEILLQGIKERGLIKNPIEITMEANPGTVEQGKFAAFYDIGINRLSLGIQSFNNEHLQKLGRIHDGLEAINAIHTVKKAGFTNFNLDLMFGLPNQTIDEGLKDLQTGIDLSPSHLSWYELTLEPNTYFWHHPPKLPENDAIADLQLQGQTLLQQNGFEQYEISAYAKPLPCYHNVNYWEFGDYLAIGAGSHAKITLSDNKVLRYNHIRNPKRYMANENNFIEDKEIVSSDQLAFEFLLNAFRLKNGICTSLFTQRTGLPLDLISLQLETAVKKGWLMPVKERLTPTPLGYLFLNDLISLFLPST